MGREPSESMPHDRQAGWPYDDDPDTLVRRVEHVLGVLERESGSSCCACDAAVCGHEILFCLSSGHQDEPLCLTCLATELGRPPQDVRDGLHRYVLSKACLRRGWHLCNGREGIAEESLPACMWQGGSAAGTQEVVMKEDPPSAPSSADATWDAGDLGCGELVLELRLRLKEMSPGQVLLLQAHDPGAPEDIPAWCRLTGHALLHHVHPDYWIRRKD